MLVSMVPNGNLAKVQTHWLEMGDFRRILRNGSAVWRITQYPIGDRAPVDAVDATDPADPVGPADPEEGSPYISHVIPQRVSWITP